jgi:hypothetical protein
MVVVRSAAGDAQVLKLANTTRRRSVLSGEVRRSAAPGGNGLTRIVSIRGLNTVRNQLERNNFRFG